MDDQPNANIWRIHDSIVTDKVLAGKTLTPEEQSFKALRELLKFSREVANATQPAEGAAPVLILGENSYWVRKLVRLNVKCFALLH
jgi:hypothetical protein